MMVAGWLYPKETPQTSQPRPTARPTGELPQDVSPWTLWMHEMTDPYEELARAFLLGPDQRLAEGLVEAGAPASLFWFV